MRCVLSFLIGFYNFHTTMAENGSDLALALALALAGLSTISRRFNAACGQIITLHVVVGGVRAAVVGVAVVGVVVGWLAD